MAAAGAREYYSISQAAALLGVSRVSIWRWIRAGHLPVSRLGHRTTRIKR
jgi:excisionase family DNA binding protein